MTIELGVDDLMTIEFSLYNLIYHIEGADEKKEVKELRDRIGNYLEKLGVVEDE